MSIVSLFAVVLALGLFLWLAAVYLPVDSHGRRLPRPRGDAAASIRTPVTVQERRGRAEK